MPAQLNHTIVPCRDQAKSAAFLADVLGLPAPKKFYHFTVVALANGVSLDFLETPEPFLVEHYAFLVTEPEFDQILTRLKQRGLLYWADPMKTQLQLINHHDGGRGVYFEDPDHHMLECITRPYGSGG